MARNIFKSNTCAGDGGGLFMSPVSTYTISGVFDGLQFYNNTRSGGHNPIDFWYGKGVISNFSISGITMKNSKLQSSYGGSGSTSNYPYITDGGNNSQITGDPLPGNCPSDISIVAVDITGTVWNDKNGNLAIGASESGTNAGGLFVNLVNNVGTVVQSVTVAANGTYAGLAYPLDGTVYKLILSTSTTSATPSLPAVVSNPWINIGETVNGNTATQSTTLGQIELPISFSSAALSGQNFGIERLPTANSVSGAYINPGGTATVQAPTLNGTDPEDGTYTGTSLDNTVIINTLPAVGTLYYDGLAVSAGQVISGYIPAELTFDPPSGSGSYSFTYSEVDAAGLSSAPATVTMNFSTVVVSGTVYHDADGGTINGTPTNTVGTNILWVSLVNGSNKVVASVAVSGGGSYSFSTADGLAANSSYLLVLSNAQGTVGGNPPSNILANAANTAEGTPPAGDGTPNGYAGITVGTTSLTNTNFAVEELPTAGSGANTVANPGGTTQVAVPLSTFNNITPATDPDGTVPNIRITGFPTGAASVVINGTTYTAAGGGGTTAWPAVGVITPVTSLGSVDPGFNGAGDVVFSFRAIDNAGKESQNTGTATMRFLVPDLTPVIRLPQNGFASEGTSLNMVVELVSLVGITTTAGSTRFSITAPVGYTISFSPSLTTITAAGAAAATAVQNGSWALVSTQLAGRRLNFQAKAGISIAALQKAELGFTLTRTTSFQGSVPVVTINIADDATWQYDSVPPNNIFTRIVNSL